MRVICINENWYGDYTHYQKPKCGDIDEVVDHLQALGPFAEAYELKRFPGICYGVENFAPLSDIDERELVNVKEEVC